MIEIDGHHLDLEQVYQVAVKKEKVKLSDSAIEKIKAGRKIVDEMLKSGKPYYGINTGVGKLAEVRIESDDIDELQKNIIRSHAVGVGEPLSEEFVRACMLLRANTLASGHSGVRVEVVEKLLEFLNNDIIPLVPSRGSVGASGDLAPLSHIALALMGEGYCLKKEEKVETSKILNEKGIKPLTLKSKEGLALINGTQATSAIISLILHYSYILTYNADLIAGMTFEALKGVAEELDLRIGDIRPHPGIKITLNNLQTFVKDSRLIQREKKRVQDAYSLRCTPQVHGAVWDILDFSKKVMNIEINSVTDNPVIFENGDIISNGNFHGQHPGIVADFLSIGLSILGNISERRSFRLITPELSGLPAFLIKESGLFSGFMMHQVTQASLVSMNKILGHPATLDSIPTSGNQEDFVSMAMNSALKLKEIYSNTRKILAIEYMMGAQAIEILGIEGASTTSKKLIKKLRGHVPFLDKDRFMYEDILSAENLLAEKLI
ncbi:MAG: histidine ammonia-lyase [bacterium]|nr:histidine ammonia-lyase [bacterium]